MAGTQTHAAFIHRHTLHLAANTCNPDRRRRKQGGPELRAGFGYLASEASLPYEENLSSPAQNRNNAAQERKKEISAKS